MKLRQDQTDNQRQPDMTSLINVVFLILIFFIVAGVLRPFNDNTIELAEHFEDSTGAIAASRLIVREDGTVRYRNVTLPLEQLTDTIVADRDLDRSKTFIVVADARLPAEGLLNVTRAVRAAGLSDISILTQRRQRVGGDPS
ncbi:MAG: biopolymer transporter ExbD [Pseudomonadota bacterium]